MYLVVLHLNNTPYFSKFLNISVLRNSVWNQKLKNQNIAFLCYLEHFNELLFKHSSELKTLWEFSCRSNSVLHPRGTEVSFWSCKLFKNICRIEGGVNLKYLSWSPCFVPRFANKKKQLPLIDKHKKYILLLF